MIQTFKNKSKNFQERIDVFRENYIKHLKKKQFYSHYLPENRKGRNSPSSFYKRPSLKEGKQINSAHENMCKNPQNTNKSNSAIYKELWDWEDDRV